jgi:hypothetical protein
MKRRMLALVGALIGAGSLFIGPADARAIRFSDLPGPFTIGCAGGLTMQVVATGEGAFAPAREVDGTRVFIPVYFGGSSFTDTSPDGEQVIGDNFNFGEKGDSGNQVDGLLHCSFEATGVSDNGPGWTRTIRGSTAGKVQPRP